MPMADGLCPKCGGALEPSGKYTAGGTDWREYVCRTCGREVAENRGQALWEVLHEAREDTEAARALSVGDRVVMAEADAEGGVAAGERGVVASVDVGAGEVEVVWAREGRRLRHRARKVRRAP
ncbi:MAG: hypothetical protein KGL53_11510 [Elusimicrobia bacterium]|nr:hypothetical protein [Elusimicrobiota bacterium]